MEDSVLLNMENCEFMRGFGYYVAGVYSAPAALEWLDNNEPLAALVTDIDLGNGPDGFDVARHARMTRPDVPIIFISGSPTARFSAAQFENAEFIPKPFYPRQVTDALARAVGRKAQSA